MTPIAPSLQTVYLDLLQSATPEAPASVVQRSVAGHSYLQANERRGGARRVRHLGRADDPEAKTEAERIKRAAEGAKRRRSLVAALRGAGVPGPSAPMGKVLEVLANAGLFESECVVLVGTAAYIVYSAALGFVLPAGSMTTQDIDLSVVSLALDRQPEIDLLEVLRCADPGFAPEQNPLRATMAPSKFRGRDGLLVEVITSPRRGDASPTPVAKLRASAEALRYQDYLVEGAERAVCLYGSGVPVLVPRPSRFGVHKLIVAGLRPEGEGARRRKDLAQAAAIRDAFAVANPDAWQDALDDATRRGRAWRSLVEAGVKAIA